MTYSRWYDAIGIISCVWLGSCFIINNVTIPSIVFGWTLELIALFCFIHYLLAGWINYYEWCKGNDV